MLVSLLGGAVQADLVAYWNLDDGAGDVAADASGNGHDGTFSGSPQWAEGLYGGALRFAGTPDRVIVPFHPDLNPEEAFTVTVWANVEPGSSSWRSPITSRDDGPQRGYILYAGDNGNWQFWIGTGSAWSNAEGPAVQMGEWTHVAGVYESGQQTLYINGVQEGQVAGTISINAESVLTIGAGASDVAAGNYFFVGLLDDVALFNTALTEQEIQDIMAGFSSTQASKPIPEDGATDLPRDTSLRWTPGTFAVEHDVYFGTSFDDVNSATIDDSAYQGRQADVTFTPDTLALAQTYFWRIDEVNAAPDKTVFKGATWSFESEPVSYPIPTGAVSAVASSSDAQGDPNNAVNGAGLNENDEHSNMQEDMWLSTADDTNATIEFGFENLQKVDKVHVWNHNTQTESILGFGIKEALIEASLDGETWTDVGTFTFSQATGTADYRGEAVSLGGIVAQSIRITGLSNYSILGLPQKGLAEVRFYAVPMRAREEDPAHTTSDVAPLVNLSWRAGREAARHEVLMGTDPDALAPIAMVDTPAYTTAVDLETTVFWQVNEVNEAGDPAVWEGDLWSFEAAAFVSVDNMESYQSKDGSWIWEVWKDGFDDDNNGALLGHNNGNDMEKNIVFAGAQSLPYYYGQGSTTQSEATVEIADLPMNEDWTIGAAETLVLRIRGDMQNGATDQLYIEVDDAKVSYEGDLITPIWRQWNVELASLGIDLTAVSTLKIGVESSGSGLFYVDDIALYRMAPPIVEPPAGGDMSLVAHWKLDETEGLTATDSSGYGNDGTLVGMEGNEWTAGIEGGALAFTGTSQYVDFGHSPSLQLTTNITLSAWVKMESDNPDAYMGIAGKMVANPYAGYGLVRHSTNVFRFWVSNQDGSNLTAATSDDTYTDTEWHHVVGVVNDNFSSLYVDGVKQIEEAPVNLTDTGDYAFIGKQYSNTDERYWKGLVDDVRIYYRALSDQEIGGL
jgi:hypothetical protein